MCYLLLGAEIIRTITPAGRWMARLPLSVRFARMLLFANQHGLMPYAVVLVAVLSVQDFFLPDVELYLEESQNSPKGENTDLTVGGRKRKRAQLSEADRIAQARINFLRQFVKTVSRRCAFKPFLLMLLSGNIIELMFYRRAI